MYKKHLHIYLICIQTLICENGIQISISTKVNHLISKELYQKQNGFKFIRENLFVLHENWLLFQRRHFFLSNDPLLIPQLSKRSKLYYFNVLKYNLCFIINIDNSLSHSQHNFSLQTFTMLQRGHLLFFLNLNTNYDYRFMRKTIL